MIKNHQSSFELQQKILNGVRKLNDAVSVTLGPGGNNVILYNSKKWSCITKDGASIVKFFGQLEDKFENIGSEIAKQAAIATEKTAGDGTTTTTLLVYEMLKECQKYLVSDVPAVELKKGMDTALEKIVTFLKEKSKPISKKEDILNIATVSANNDFFVGNLITNAIDKIGKDGSITIQESKTLETNLNLIEGFNLPSGFTSQEFVTDESRQVMKYHNPLILVTDEKITLVEQILPILELAARDKRPLIIIADEIVDQALAAIILNTVRGSMKVAAVKSPFYGQQKKDTLNDLSISIGATFFSKLKGMKIENAKLKDFGTADIVESNKFSTLFIGGRGNYEEIEKQINILTEEIKQNEDLDECQKIQERITRLSSGVAIIKIGGATEVEVLEKKHRIEDALEAVKSAQQEGILPGGGIALLNASKYNHEINLTENEKIGFNIILKSIKKPFYKICENANLNPELIENNIINSCLEEDKNYFSYGFNIVNNHYNDLYEEGVVDPTKVIRMSLTNAVSVVSNLIMTKYAISE